MPRSAPAHRLHRPSGPPWHRAAVAGDSIYNGALDNALGVDHHGGSGARTGTTDRCRSARFFVALTAEVKGPARCGVVRQPSAGLACRQPQMDMPVLMAPSKDVVRSGSNIPRSRPRRRRSQDVWRRVVADPFRKRSCSYAAIIRLHPRRHSGGVSRRRRGRRRQGARPQGSRSLLHAQLFHQPCDDASQPIQYGDAAPPGRLNARIGRLVGDACRAYRAGTTAIFFANRFVKPASMP